jgi:hypothetical protein
VKKNEKQYEGKLGSIIRYDSIRLALQEIFVSLDTAILVKLFSIVLKTMSLFEARHKSPKLVKQVSALDGGQRRRHELCSHVDASRLQFDESQALRVNKISFGEVAIGSMRMLLTLQVDKDRRVDKEISTASPAVNAALYILAPLLQNFANVSDTKIGFPEMVLVEAYISQDMLVKGIVDHYVHALKAQIFRIVGSSNLLGNPANLLSKAGQGFFVLARDPLAGIIEGPSGFVKGLKSGM